MVLIVIIKVRAVGVMIWHVPVDNVPLSPVSLPFYCQDVLKSPDYPWTVQCQTVGASMGLQAACPDHSDQSCQISCQDPTNSQACIRLTSLLIDGSPCGMCYHVVQSEALGY